MLRPALLALALPLLAGCNTAGGPVASTAAGMAPQRFPDVVMPSGTGCTAEIGRFEAVLRADLETGNVAARVHEQIQRELQPVRGSCSAGNDAQALTAVGAIKRRYGYPG